MSFILSVCSIVLTSIVAIAAANVEYPVANFEYDGTTLLFTKSDHNDAKYFPKDRQTTSHPKPSLNQAVKAVLRIDPANIRPSAGYRATLKNMLDVTFWSKAQGRAKEGGGSRKDLRDDGDGTGR